MSNLPEGTPPLEDQVVVKTPSEKKWENLDSNKAFKELMDEKEKLYQKLPKDSPERSAFLDSLVEECLEKWEFVQKDMYRSEQAERNVWIRVTNESDIRTVIRRRLHPNKAAGGGAAGATTSSNSNNKSNNNSSKPKAKKGEKKKKKPAASKKEDLPWEDAFDSNDELLQKFAQKSDGMVTVDAGENYEFTSPRVSEIHIETLVECVTLKKKVRNHLKEKAEDEKEDSAYYDGGSIVLSLDPENAKVYEGLKEKLKLVYITPQDLVDFLMDRVIKSYPESEGVENNYEIANPLLYVSPCGPPNWPARADARRIVNNNNKPPKKSGLLVLSESAASPILFDHMTECGPNRFTIKQFVNFFNYEESEDLVATIEANQEAKELVTQYGHLIYATEGNDFKSSHGLDQYTLVIHNSSQPNTANSESSKKEVTIRFDLLPRTKKEDSDDSDNNSGDGISSSSSSSSNLRYGTITKPNFFFLLWKLLAIHEADSTPEKKFLKVILLQFARAVSECSKFGDCDLEIEYPNKEVQEHFEYGLKALLKVTGKMADLRGERKKLRKDLIPLYKSSLTDNFVEEEIQELVSKFEALELEKKFDLGPLKGVFDEMMDGSAEVDFNLESLDRDDEAKKEIEGLKKPLEKAIGKAAQFLNCYHGSLQSDN